MKKPIHLLGLGAAILSIALFSAAEVSAQRGGRGGGRGGGGGGGIPQVRSSAGGSMQSASRSSGNINRSASRSGNRVNTGNINTGDVNIDVDRGCCGGGWGYNYHPVARGAAVAATTAAVMGAYYSSLPGSCASISRAAMTYYQCGSTWYQPIYTGADVQYVVVQAP